MSFLLAGLAGAASAAPATLTEQLASAHSLAGGQLLYREQHLVRMVDAAPSERLVLYRCPGGAAFARKRVDYSRTLLAPAFDLEDARSGYREGLRVAPGGGAELYFRARSGEAEQHAVLAQAPDVADAGFDEWLRNRWGGLAAGDVMQPRFAIPSRLETLTFQVRRTGEQTIGGARAVTFRMRLDGLLGYLVPHIDVAYDARSQRLLRFEGLGNLRDASGDRQLQVRIDFPDAPHPATPAQWSEALSEPLVRRCESGQQADSSAGRTLRPAAQVTDS